MPLDATNKPPSDNIESLEAFISSFEEGADVALRKLEGKDDPDSIRRRLAILNREGRYLEAADLVRGLKPQEGWCEQAVIAFVRNNEGEKAKQIIEWSKLLDNRNTRHRCILAFAEGLGDHIFRNRREGEYILPGELTEQERNELHKIKDALDPLLAIVTAKDQTENELECLALYHGIRVEYLLGAQKAADKFSDILSKRKPLHLGFAEAVIRRWTQRVPEELPKRLRDDHGGSFRARYWATVIEGILLHKPRPALEDGRHVVALATTDNEREEIGKLLVGLARQVGPEASTGITELAQSLVQQDQKFLELMRAEDLLQTGNTAQAKDQLEGLRDDSDPRWLQLYAECLERSGDSPGALDALVKASKIVPHPGIYRKTADLAFKHQRLTDASEVLEKLLRVEPGDAKARQNLAQMYLEIGDFTSAAKHFQILHDNNPQTQSYAVNLAFCLASSGRREASLKIYNHACNQETPLLQAFLGRAGVLKAMNRPDDAFQSLNGVREKYWDDPQFVLQFLDLAFAAQQESAGHEAFLRLRQLQSEGKAAPDILREQSFDDLVTFLKARGEQREEILKNVMQGKIPWLAAEHLFGRVPYWGWYLKTQPLQWLSEDSMSRTEYTIYSTNSYAVRVEAGGNRALEELSCPPQMTPIVGDMSALITLHRLNLLEEAAAYFGSISIPSVYFSQALAGEARLVLHQKSLKTSLAEIKAALDHDRIRVIEAIGKPGQRPHPYVHEHTINDGEEHYYRLRDIIDLLSAQGLITDVHRGKLEALAHKPSGVDAGHASLTAGQALLFDLSTLKTLSSGEALEFVLKTFQVCVSNHERDEVLAGVRAIEAQEVIYRWHSDLWDVLRQDTRFIQTPVPSEVIKPDELDRGPHLAALAISKERSLPLLADDRVCQSAMLNTRRNDPHASFGTDRFLWELHKAGRIDAAHLADAFLQIIGWRYRFIIPPVQILKTLADRYIQHPPGKPLRDVALYVHDCMRDPGLFGGFEPTEPPVTIGQRLCLRWAWVLSDFIMSIWADEQYSDANAQQLTEWCLKECLPSPPRTMGELGAEAVMQRIANSVLSCALLGSYKIQNVKRANKGLVVIADALALDQLEYCRISTEVIDGIRKREH